MTLCVNQEIRQTRRDERRCAEKFERHSRRKGEEGIDGTNMKEKSQRDS